jgi:hypothetical protein
MIERWLEGLDDATHDFKRRVLFAETAFLALCEALLKDDPPRSAKLWRMLNRTLQTRFTGAAGVDELLRIAFTAPSSTGFIQIMRRADPTRAVPQ